jgi:hypothetical protein
MDRGGSIGGSKRTLMNSKGCAVLCVFVFCMGADFIYITSLKTVAME